MERQAQILPWASTLEIQVIVDGQLFTVKKSSEFGVLTMHSQQIGDDKFIIAKQILDKNYQPMTDELTIETSKDMDIESFKAEWESGWNPMLHQETEPTGFFSHLKKLKFW